MQLSYRRIRRYLVLPLKAAEKHVTSSHVRFTEKEEDLLMFLLKLVGKVVAAPFCLIEELRNRLAMFIVS